MNAGRALSILCLSLFATSLQAQETRAIADLDADRVNATQVKVEFEYEGSACEAVLPATLGAPSGTTLSVTFPTERTAEICTQQIVEIEVDQTIDVDASVTYVAVTLLDPDGNVIATGTEQID
jgi:hypothetical protein